MPIVLESDDKVEHDNKWWKHREKITQLDKQRRQAFYNIRGRFMKVLLDIIRYDPYWDFTSESYNPLTLIKLIEKIK